jgi:hypothetical protein
MSDNNDILNQGEELLSKLNDTNPMQKRVIEISNSDPLLRLKTSIFEFFVEHLKDVSSQERLRAKVQESFLEDLENYEEPLTFQERMSLYKLISKEANSSSDSILGLFKPSPGAPSILAENLSREENKDDIFEEIFSEMNVEERNSMEELRKLLDRMDKGNK